MATIEQFSECNQQISLLNDAILEPLAGVEIPPCDELTPGIARAIQLQVFATYLGSIAVLFEGEEENPLSEDGNSPCDEIEMACPDFAVPIGADLFSE
jgi:hypothetical protein